MGGKLYKLSSKNCETWIILEKLVTYSELGVCEGFLEEVTFRMNILDKVDHHQMKLGINGLGRRNSICKYSVAEEIAF